MTEHEAYRPVNHCDPVLDHLLPQQLDQACRYAAGGLGLINMMVTLANRQFRLSRGVSDQESRDHALELIDAGFFQTDCRCVYSKL
jgi:hypothetical protein